MTLIRLRLRWYAVATARLLLRRWQAVVLLLGVLAAANVSLFSNLDSLAYPLLVWLEPGHGIAWRFRYLLVLQAAAALWAFMQREQIKGGGFMQFAGSLPFSSRQRRHVDIAVLIMANSPLLLVVAAALSVVAAHGYKAAHLLVLCDVALLALVTQLGVLERRFSAWAGVAVACLLLAAGIGTRFALAASLFTGVGAGISLGLGPWLPSASRLRLQVPVPSWPGRLMQAVVGRHYPALRASFGILYRERRNETVAKALGAAGVAVAAVGLMAVFDYDDRIFPVALLAQGLIALTVSGMFRGLQMTHCASANYVAALPLKKNWWLWFDVTAILTFGLPFLIGLAAVPWLKGAATGSQALAGTISYSTLLCVLRAPQLFSERHAVVLSAGLAVCWTGATIGLLI